MKTTTATFLFLSGLTGAAQAACGPEPDACLLQDGEYHVVLPDTKSARTPMVLFLHGWGSSGDRTLNNTGMVNALQARGYAIVAPTGSRSVGSGNGHGWTFYPGWDGRDETDFLKRVRADAADRFDLDEDRTLLAGFSGGGFMVNYLACKEPMAFAAYAPVSGGFWRPHPTECAAPVRLFHTHGWRDTTVPLEGRILGGGRFQQGDIFAGLEIWRAANQCPDEKATEFSETGHFWRRAWTGCTPGSALELALFPGGHSVPAGWSDMVLDWFEDGLTN
ncbi:alpha/beta hydrolase family esterase [Sedimentitalea todarodis]|uniref:PHB depolymerase family esterase n=1 Tax=Sedimentitalea todarodis TaxID=1631240 RepID=A0ABU3VE07_9RHOB|nr:PHB depolymerase family esterase [Sedimentitalea todarodis]MDU9003959.1 PHB depolymerase family esterase [Sedimentitalea todarodis]